MTEADELNLFRMTIHLSGGLVPLLDLQLGREFTLLGLTAAAILYTLSEILRARGRRFPIIHRMTLEGSRNDEAKGVVVAPLYLAAGVVVSLLLFPRTVAYISILLVTLGDGFAELIGKTWGRSHIRFNQEKTWEGTLLGFATTGLIMLLLGAPPLTTAISTIVAGVVESSPSYLDDNVTVPLAAGTAATLSLMVL